MSIKSYIANWLKTNHKELYDSIFPLYYYWMPKEAPVDDLIEKIAIKNNLSFFVQIGANDGVRNDPVYKLRRKYAWQGVLVEPQKNAYKKLQYNFQNDSSVSLVNAAISNFTGQEQLYKLSFCDDEWATARSTFRRETLEKSINAGIIDKIAHQNNIQLPARKEDYISAEPVKCITFTDLFEENKVDQVDVLFVDTEGFDYEVLKLFDFNVYKPLIIQYEYKHLTLSDYRNSVRLMKNKGYKLYRKKDSDILCIHHRALI